MRFRRVGLIVVLVGLATSCVSAVPGIATAPPRPMPTEEAASWANSVLDPCALLCGTPGLVGAAEVETPHMCSIRHTDKRLATLQLGAFLGHYARSVGKHVVEGGLQGYERWFPKEKPDGANTCWVDVPLSFTRSVRVLVVTAEEGRETSCSLARASMITLAGHLRDVGSAPRRQDPPTALGR